MVDTTNLAGLLKATGSKTQTGKSISKVISSNKAAGKGSGSSGKKTVPLTTFGKQGSKQTGKVNTTTLAGIKSASGMPTPRQSIPNASSKLAAFRKSEHVVPKSTASIPNASSKLAGFRQSEHNVPKPNIPNASPKLAEFRKEEHNVPKPTIPNASDKLRDFRLSEHNVPTKPTIKGFDWNKTNGNKTINDSGKTNGSSTGSPGTTPGTKQPDNKTATEKANAAVKIATNNIFYTGQDPVTVNLMQRLFFEEIGGQELINISRNDLLSGQPLDYTVIKNLASLSIEYDPNKLLALQGTDVDYFSDFSFVLEKFVPDVGTGVNISEVQTGERVYVEPSTGNVIVNTINVKSSQSVDIEFLSFEDIIDDTIY
jgi:hypothetical protein